MKSSEIFKLKILTVFGSICASLGTFFGLIYSTIADPITIQGQAYSFSGYFYFSALTYAIGLVGVAAVCAAAVTWLTIRHK